MLFVTLTSAQSTQLFLDNCNKWRTNPSQTQVTDFKVIIYTILSASTQFLNSFLKQAVLKWWNWWFIVAVLWIYIHVRQYSII